MRDSLPETYGQGADIIRMSGQGLVHKKMPRQTVHDGKHALIRDAALPEGLHHSVPEPVGINAAYALSERQFSLVLPHAASPGKNSRTPFPTPHAQKVEIFRRPVHRISPHPKRIPAAPLP